MNYFDLYDQAVQLGSVRDQSQHEDVLSQTTGVLSEALSSALQGMFDSQVDFSSLTMPLAYLVVYQICPGRFEAPGPQPGLKSFSSYKELASICPGDETHALMVSLMESPEPGAMARELLEDMSPEQREIADERTTAAREESVSGTKIGVCFGVSFLERCAFKFRMPGKLRFVRGRDLTSPQFDVSQRFELLQLVETHLPLDRKLRSALIYMVLTMPTFMLEGFEAYRVAADKTASALKALVIGTEFQRKPLVAMLVALMKKSGKPVIGVQHGGGYRQTDPNWWERAERFLCDAYQTWGYQVDPFEQPLPSIKLSRQSIKIGKKTEANSYTGRDLKILLAIPYVSDELECSLYSPPYQLQVAAVESSLAILAPLLERDCELTIRIHPKNKGAAFTESLSVSGHPNVQISTGRRGSIAEDALAFTALFFSSPQATGIAECLATGTKFFVAASPEYFWIRDEAEALYQEMHRCGIWLTRFDELEDLMQTGFAPPSHRQQVFRHSFGKTYACHSDDYMSQWLKMLKNV